MPNSNIQELEEQLRQAYADARGMQEHVTGRPRGEHVQLVNSVPNAEGKPFDQYAPTTWGAGEYDFVVPSGQRCRLRKMQVEELAKRGILDKVTRLPGLTETVIQKAEGQPPEKVAEMPSAETIKTVTDLVNELIPLVVIAPVISPIPAENEERTPGRIYVDSIDIEDRIAILNRAIGGLKNLDTFRN